MCSKPLFSLRLAELSLSEFFASLVQFHRFGSNFLNELSFFFFFHAFDVFLTNC